MLFLFIIMSIVKTNFNLFYNKQDTYFVLYFQYNSTKVGVAVNSSSGYLRGTKDLTVFKHAYCYVRY